MPCSLFNKHSQVTPEEFLITTKTMNPFKELTSKLCPLLESDSLVGGCYLNYLTTERPYSLLATILLE